MTTQQSDAQTRVERLTAARRADSKAKRARARNSIERLVSAGIRVTYARVAREADVSTWMLYNVAELRIAIDAAITEQRATGVVQPPPAPRTAGAESLRTDLALAREEIKALRSERERLRDRLRKTLGAEIDQTSRADLIEHVQRLEDKVRVFGQEREAARSEADTLRPQVEEFEAQIEAQRDLNHDLMRQVNTLKHH